MILKLTKTGKDFFDNIRLDGFTTSHDFVYFYSCMDDPCHAIAEQAGNYPESFKCKGTTDCQIDFHHHYCCNFGEEMVVNDNHYSQSEDLQSFVSQGYLEIV